MTGCYCQGQGAVRISYDSGEPDDYGLCLCKVGRDLRSDLNAGKHTGYPLWLVWAAQRQIAPERIYAIEDLLDTMEMVERYPFWRPAQAADAPAEASAATVAAAMKTRKGAKL